MRPIPGSHFEETSDGEPELVVRGGRDAFRFRHGANGDPMLLDSGTVREAAALKTLAQNGWLEGTVEGLELRIRLGPKAKELRKGALAAASA